MPPSPKHHALFPFISPTIWAARPPWHSPCLVPRKTALIPLLEKEEGGKEGCCPKALTAPAARHTSLLAQVEPRLAAGLRVGRESRRTHPPPRCPTCGLVSSSGGKGRKEGEGSPTPSTIVLGRRDPREPILHLHGLLGSHSKRSNLASPS